MDLPSSYLTGQAHNEHLIIVYTDRFGLGGKSCFVTVNEVFKATSKVGTALLNTWVSNNKLTLIEQLDSSLLCSQRRETRGEK